MTQTQYTQNTQLRPQIHMVQVLANHNHEHQRARLCVAGHSPTAGSCEGHHIQHLRHGKPSVSLAANLFSATERMRRERTRQRDPLQFAVGRGKRRRLAWDSAGSGSLSVTTAKRHQGSIATSMVSSQVTLKPYCRPPPSPVQPGGTDLSSDPHPHRPWSGVVSGCRWISGLGRGWGK